MSLSPTSMSEVIYEIVVFDLDSLSERTGLDRPNVSPRLRSELALLFQTAVLGAAAQGLAREWTT